MPEGNLALKVSNLGKTFQRKFRGFSLCALKDVFLEVPQGMTLGIVGPNRSGKSTLIQLCLGLLKPTVGSIQIFGRPISEIARPTGMSAILQSVTFPAYLTPVEILFFLGSIALVPEETLETKLNQILVNVKLHDSKNSQIREFSRGMLQRLLIAQGMLADPDLLFLDEPSESLDMDGIEMLMDWICKRKNAGKTSILASHDLKLVQSTCEQVALLQRGILSEPKTILAWTNQGGLPFEEAIRKQLDPGMAKDSK